MKKLLLLSLLVLGANSFGAVTGSQVSAGQNGVVSLPIKAKANVVSVSGKTLIISADTVGMDGSEMEFNFGDIEAGKEFSHSLDGRFTVKLADASAFEGEGDDPSGSGKSKLQLSFKPASFTPADKTITTTGTSGGVLPDGMNIVYNLTGDFTPDMTQYKGRVNAVINVASSVSDAGSYIDNTQRIYAKLSVGN